MVALIVSFLVLLIVGFVNSVDVIIVELDMIYKEIDVSLFVEILVF